MLGFSSHPHHWLAAALVAAAPALSPSQLSAQTDDVARARRIADVAATAAAEYANAVIDGTVARREELEETRLFLGDARRVADGLTDVPRAIALRHLERLIQGVEALVPAAELEPAFRALRADLSAAVGAELDLYPDGAVSLARGEMLFGTHCARCHGDAGAGDGVLAGSLDPAPPDLTSVPAVSLVALLRKVNVGVAGTAMPAFADRLDLLDRWSVAMYAASLRYPADLVARGARLLAGCDACGLLLSDLRRTAPLDGDSLLALVAAGMGHGLDPSAATAAVAYARVAAAREHLGGKRGLAAGRVASQASGMADSAAALAARGVYDEAVQVALDAYLVFESIEGAVRARDGRSARRVEQAFARLRGSLRPDVSGSEREEARLEFAAALSAAAGVLVERASPLAVFGQSLIIMVREGLEAILIVGALVTFLVRAGAPERKRDLMLGVAAAVLASLATAALFVTVLRAAVGHQEMLEGITMLAAAIALFWVSYWLVSKIEMRKWREFVRARMATALRSRRSWALAGVAFLAVYREGFETVLFYAALVTSADGSPVALGAVAGGITLGAVVLGAVYYAMQRWGVRLPLKPFFAVTSALLYAMAFSFAGQGVAALQAVGAVPATPLAWLPSVPALGIFPTFQTLASQLLLSVALVAALAWVFWIEPRTATVKPVP